MEEKQTFLDNYWQLVSIGYIIMIQVIGIPMGFDPAPFFVNIFLAHKEAEWAKTA